MLKPIKKDCREKRLPTRKYHAFLAYSTLIFATFGCAHSPLNQEWEWSIRPFLKNADQEARDLQRRDIEMTEAAFKVWPELEHASSDDIIEIYFVEFPEKNGRKQGTATLTK
jgi:hypothetical protein